MRKEDSPEGIVRKLQQAYRLSAEGTLWPRSAVGSKSLTLPGRTP